jgi:hypothetical protein
MRQPKLLLPPHRLPRRAGNPTLRTRLFRPAGRVAPATSLSLPV